MRLVEMRLDEVAVFSSWIDELEINPEGDVLMTLLSGRQYVVHEVGEDLYVEWLDADSKGKFWHGNIRDMYIVSRV
jgi:uncharacterized protein YlzI (FlbEa/FlbD family)